MPAAPLGLLLAGLLAVALSPALAQTPQDALFDDSAVAAVSLSMDPADWSALQRKFRENTYYRAEFSWNGKVLANIGVRSHGGVSRLPTKPNLDVNFARYDQTQRLLGLPFLVLKANNRDPSNMREWISMALFRKMGIPAPREAPARVTINGALLGFYMIVEHVDETFLADNFGESWGRLYKWRNRTNYEFDDLGPIPANYQPLLQFKSKQGSGDWRDFADFIQVVHRPAAPAKFVQASSRYFDPIAFLTHLAAENVLAEYDGMAGGLVGMNNFYLYQGKGSTRYRIIPWDKDLTFSWLERDVLEGITLGKNINLLAKRLAGIPEFRYAYLRALAKAANLLGGTGGWADREIEREYGVIRGSAVDDPNKWCFDHACGAEQFETDVRWLHAFLSERSRNVLDGVAKAGHSGDRAP